MDKAAKSAAVFLISSPTVQSLIDCKLYRVCGQESITASVIRAAEAFTQVAQTKKPSGLAAKLAMEFFSVGAGRVLLHATDRDFVQMAGGALDQAVAISLQLEEGDEVVAPTEPAKDEPQSQSELEGQSAPTESARDAEPAITTEGTPEAPGPATESQPEPQAEAKPEDVPVEKLADFGLPAGLIEALVAAGLTTAKAVRERDTAKPIDDLPGVGPAIRKKIIAAIGEAIA